VRRTSFFGLARGLLLFFWSGGDRRFIVPVAYMRSGDVSWFPFFVADQVNAPPVCPPFFCLSACLSFSFSFFLRSKEMTISFLSWDSFIALSSFFLFLSRVNLVGLLLFFIFGFLLLFLVPPLPLPHSSVFLPVSSLFGLGLGDYRYLS